jgi:hypothetical protein
MVEQEVQSRNADVLKNAIRTVKCLGGKTEQENLMNCFMTVPREA